MDLPILYTFRRCPYAMRARMALYHNNQPFIVREVDLKNKPQEMLDISPKGTVPVMHLPDGVVLEESMHIMHWAFDRGSEKDRRYRENELLVIEQLISENDGPFKYILDRYKYPDRYPTEERRTKEQWREEADRFLGKLEMFLTHNTYLFGDKPSIEDLAIVPFVRQFKHVDANWFEAQAPYPYVKEWMDGMLESEIFTGVMEKYTPWQPQDDVVIFRP